jgi:acyl-CoA-binding protein
MTLKDEFTAKANSMKLWEPVHKPTNRDRLELWSLLKQSVSGDCKEPPPDSSKRAESEKWGAWKSKEGLTQSEAMARYITESDRQIHVYGSLAGPSTSTVASSSSSVVGASPSSSSPPLNRCTLRGIASLPFLVSAASESRASYLRRLSVMTASSRFWDKQAALATTKSEGPTDFKALPARVANALENGILMLGKGVERLATSSVLGLNPTTLHAMSYPLHVLILTLWIALIFVVSLLSISVSVLLTLLFGSRETKMDLASLLDDGLRPTSLAASSLSARSHPLPLRCLAFLLSPLPLLASVVWRAREAFGDAPACACLLAVMGATAWYWSAALPAVLFWFGGWSGGLATVAAGLIEAAGLGDDE